ncbi:hypothetical protein A7M79_07230 [Acinetobacter baumannii]|uniref:hypothetical protein n=1 Tax=Acinetobacter baumannii TaxID=470 RepID=UPI0008DD0B31|nr:hypothetical protein [Acinetobacter baumannii]OIH08599.1 hypothetical protein A7M79_07230 [Acinetobacter baumannii]
MKNKLRLPVIQHHPKPNIIANWREFSKNNIPYHSFIEYPSVKIEFDNLEEILQILDEAKTNCIFVDGTGDSLIIPSYYQNIIDWLITNFRGTVIDNCYGKEFEFVTLAIKNGLNGQLVELGHSIFGLDGTAHEMLKKAVKNPNQAIADWSDLYKRSMMPI